MSRYEEVDLLQTEAERNTDKFFLDSVKAGGLSQKEFTSMTNIELVHKLLEGRRADPISGQLLSVPATYLKERVASECDTSAIHATRFEECDTNATGNATHQEECDTFATLDSIPATYQGKIPVHCLELLLFIAKNPRCTVGEITEGLNRHRSTIYRQLNNLDSYTENALFFKITEGKSMRYMVTGLGIKLLEKVMKKGK